MNDQHHAALENLIKGKIDLPNILASFNLDAPSFLKSFHSKLHLVGFLNGSQKLLKSLANNEVKVYLITDLPDKAISTLLASKSFPPDSFSSLSDKILQRNSDEFRRLFKQSNPQKTLLIDNNLDFLKASFDDGVFAFSCFSHDDDFKFNKQDYYHSSHAFFASLSEITPELIGLDSNVFS